MPRQMAFAMRILETRQIVVVYVYRGAAQEMQLGVCWGVIDPLPPAAKAALGPRPIRPIEVRSRRVTRCGT